MTVEEAITELQTKITAASGGAVVRAKKISDEEARISVYAPAGDITTIQDATRDLSIKMLSDGLDMQVFVYDSATTKVPD